MLIGPPDIKKRTLWSDLMIYGFPNSNNRAPRMVTVLFAQWDSHFDNHSLGTVHHDVRNHAKKIKCGSSPKASMIINNTNVHNSEGNSQRHQAPRTTRTPSMNTDLNGNNHNGCYGFPANQAVLALSITANGLPARRAAVLAMS